MRKTLTIIIALASCLATNAQEVEPESVFEVGRPITRCEDNLENLIANWRPGTIDNTHEIKILGYERAAVLSDSLSLSNYTDSVAMLDYPLSRNWMSSRGSSNENIEEHYGLQIITRKELLEQDSTLPAELKELQRISMLQEGYLMKRRLQHITLPKNTIVYRLFLEQNGKIYREFVFFDPETCRVVEESIFRSIPVRFFTKKQ